MTYYFALAAFPDYDTTSKARDVVVDEYEQLGVVAGAFIERDAAGDVRVREQGSTTTFGDVVGGTAVAGLVGLLLAGPGGAAAGAAIGGGGTAISKTWSAADVVKMIGSGLNTSSTGLVLQTTGPESSKLDSMVSAHGGTITRFTDDDL